MTAEPAGRIRPTEWDVLVLVVCLSAALQYHFIDRQGIWADEAFSLAIATGHSLEHASHEADPTLGDYVELPGPVPASTFQRYLEHENPPAGMGRVIRAVALSDTNPPLYYLALNLWMRVFGTGDLALRLFSIACAIASFPVLCLVAYRIGGRRAMLPALIFLGAAPMSLTYSIEGRMYSMLWFLALSLMALTIALKHRGRQWVLLPAWVLVGAAGFLTHYFFAFVWGGCVAWLFLGPGRLARWWVTAAAALTTFLVLPWYAVAIQTFGRWRITAGWLNWPLSVREAIFAPFQFAWNFVSGPWWDGRASDDWVIGITLGLVGLAAWRSSRSRLFSGDRGLIWLCLGAACVGPVVFDLINGTGTARVERYALAGLPAAILLLAFGVSRLQPISRGVVILVLVVAWTAGNIEFYRAASRQSEPFREIGASVNPSIGSSDVVLVHSIPSGVAAIARYLAPDVQMASWVGQLGQRRVPDDVKAITEGRSRVVLIKIHEVFEPAPEEAWLREHAVVVGETVQQRGHIITFAPRGLERFAWPPDDAEGNVSP